MREKYHYSTDGYQIPGPKHLENLARTADRARHLKKRVRRREYEEYRRAMRVSKSCRADCAFADSLPSVKPTEQIPAIPQEALLIIANSIKQALSANPKIPPVTMPTSNSEIELYLPMTPDEAIDVTTIRWASYLLATQPILNS